MKKLGRSSEKLETLNLFSRLQQRGGPAIYDPANKKSFLERIETGLDKGLLASSTLHGVRVELLFQFMVANIGKVKLIKEEDTGDCFYSGEPLMVPDYRVVLESGMNLLIEVKNHFHKDPMRPFKLKSSYVESLQRFAELVGTPLKIAIYWSRWNKWSLNDPQRFRTNGAHKELALTDAFIKNEMAVLGDIAIGTVPPLQLRLKASRNHPREWEANGTRARITIAGFDVLAQGQVLEHDDERTIALYLMMFGGWDDSGEEVELDSGGLPSSILYTMRPHEENEAQGFDFVGELSSLFSKFYNSFTVEQDGRVSGLWRVDEPSKLSPLIPVDYKGKQLKLWRFTMEPNFDDDAVSHS